MTIDHTDPRSPSQQIADDLRQEINAGTFAAGDPLPSERKLVERYGTAPQTTRQAVAILKAEGLVVGRSGRGIFVRERLPIVRVGSDNRAQWRERKGQSPMQAEAEANGLSWYQEVLGLETVPAPDWVAQRFEIDTGEQVFVRRRRTWIEGVPTQLADSYYLLPDAEGTRIMSEDTGPGGSYAQLEERGLVLARFREEIGIRMPTPYETRQLRLGPGVPVADMYRVAFTTERPIEVFRSVLAGTSHVFVYEFDAPV